MNSHFPRIITLLRKERGLSQKKAAEAPESCWRDYLALCKVGGSLGYLDTLRAANLSVPFEAGSVKKATDYAMDILERQIAKAEKE